MAKRAGIAEEALAHYRKRGSEPSRRSLIALARAGGVSLDWLATGVERELDLPRLQAALEAYDEGLKVTGRITRNSAKRAQLIAAIYSWLGKQRRAPKRAEIIELFNQVA